MQPDFSKPAFAFVALSAVRFYRPEEGGGAGPYRSDYRCQLRYVDDAQEGSDAEVRVYLVGRGTANAGENVPVLLAFLDLDRARERCREGTQFELREGNRVTAAGVVHAVAARHDKL